MIASLHPAKNAPRLGSVDAFRLIAITAVAAIHTTPFLDMAAKQAGHFELLGVGINQFARFAVPFFFVVSGYFWGMKIRAGTPIASASWRMIKRLFFLYVVWCLIYLLPYNFSAIAKYGLLGPFKLSFWNIQRLVAHPSILLFEGTHQHLWFLSALIFAVALTSVFVARGYLKSLIVLAICLYIFGIAAFGYSDTPFGIAFPFTTRDGPFFSTIFFVTGYFLSASTPSEAWLGRGAAIFVAGCVMQFVEVFGLLAVYNSYPLKDFVFGTYFMGLGVALMALSNHPWVCWPAASKIGRMTLGIYLIHFIFVELLEPIDDVVHNAFWEISYPIIVVGLAIASVCWLARFSLLRPILI